MNRSPQIFAHRGASLVAPENTIPAFERAIAMGADVLETDVHWTQDGVIVVSHDADVSRLSNGQGEIAKMTFAELSRLDFGWHFTQDEGKTYPFRDCGVSIVSFTELLQHFPNQRFNVDIKPCEPASLQQFVRILHDSDALDRVTVASFHHHILSQIRQMNRHIQTSASRREIMEAFAESLLPVQAHPPYIAAQIPIRSGPLPVATRHFVRALHRRGVAVDVWTVDDAGEMRKLLAMGVDGIVTNRPDVGVEIRNQFLLQESDKDPTV